TRKRLGGRPPLGGERVADAEARHVLQAHDDVADLAGCERLRRLHRRREEAELLGLEPRTGRHRVQALAAPERSVDDADEGVGASMPCAASTTSSAPSHAWSERDTSYVKSTCPGVSIRLSSWPFQSTRTACALIVIPRSRSRSIVSSTCSRISRLETASVSSRLRSASGDLPWSMWAMIEKLRILLWSMGAS